MKGIQWLALALLLTACCPKSTLLTFEEDFLDYALYEPGTWWVYEKGDSIRDSLWVVEQDYHENELVTDEDKPNCEPQLRAAAYHVNVKSNLTGFENIHILYLPESCLPRVVYTIPKTSTVFFMDEQFNWNTSIDSYLDTLTVEGKLYSDIVVMRDTMDLQADSLETLNYYARHFWLIRKEIVPTGETWNLVKSNIVQ